MKASQEFFPTYNTRFIALSAYDGFTMIEDAIFGIKVLKWGNIKRKQMASNF